MDKASFIGEVCDTTSHTDCTHYMGLRANSHWVSVASAGAKNGRRLARVVLGWIPGESFIVVNGTQYTRFIHGWFYRESDGEFLSCMYVPRVSVASIEFLDRLPDGFTPRMPASLYSETGRVGNLKSRRLSFFRALSGRN